MMNLPANFHSLQGVRNLQPTEQSVLGGVHRGIALRNPDGQLVYVIDTTTVVPQTVHFLQPAMTISEAFRILQQVQWNIQDMIDRHQADRVPERTGPAMQLSMNQER